MDDYTGLAVSDLNTDPVNPSPEHIDLASGDDESTTITAASVADSIGSGASALWQGTKDTVSATWSFVKDTTSSVYNGVVGGNIKDILSTSLGKIALIAVLVIVGYFILRKELDRA